jgi:hybrid cluster-associated redox disulfide protein
MTDEAPKNETCAVPPVTRKTLIFTVLQTRPLAGKVLREAFGLPCDECVVSETETIEQGARYYGHDADAIVARLNECPPLRGRTSEAPRDETKLKGGSPPESAKS